MLDNSCVKPFIFTIEIHVYICSTEARNMIENVFF
jgi:hypothetical protein